MIKDDQKVKLEVVYEKYDRFGGDGTHKRIIERDTYLQALKDMCDRMSLYIDSDVIEENEMSCEQIIDSIVESNGDGADFIISLKDLISGEQIISEDYYDEEEW